MLITDLGTDSEITWLAVDIFQNIRRLQGKKQIHNDGSIRPMFF